MYYLYAYRYCKIADIETHNDFLVSNEILHTSLCDVSMSKTKINIQVNHPQLIITLEPGDAFQDIIYDDDDKKPERFRSMLTGSCKCKLCTMRNEKKQWTVSYEYRSRDA